MPKKKVTFATDVKFVPIESLFPADWNYKVDGDDETNAKFDASLLESKVTPLHVATCAESKKPRMEVLDGNHRLQALKRLKVAQVPVIDHGKLTEVERKALSVRYNGTWFQVHSVKLAECFKSLDEVDASQFDTLPYSAADVEHLLASLEQDVKPVAVFSDDDEDELVSAPKPKSKAKSPDKITCPHCKKTFVASRVK